MSEKNRMNETIIVAVKGDVDIYSVDAFRGSIEKTFDDNGLEIVLDCSELTYIDSIGIGALIEMRNKSQEKGKKIIVKNPKPNIKKLLELTGVDRIIDIVESPSFGN